MSSPLVQIFHEALRTLLKKSKLKDMISIRMRGNAVIRSISVNKFLLPGSPVFDRFVGAIGGLQEDELFEIRGKK